MNWADIYILMLYTVGNFWLSKPVNNQPILIQYHEAVAPKVAQMYPTPDC